MFHKRKNHQFWFHGLIWDIQLFLKFNLRLWVSECISNIYHQQIVAKCFDFNFHAHSCLQFCLIWQHHITLTKGQRSTIISNIQVFPNIVLQPFWFTFTASFSTLYSIGCCMPLIWSNKQQLLSYDRV